MYIETSLVVQWSMLPMQGTGVQFLVRELDPIYCNQEFFVCVSVCVCSELLLLCPTFCNPMDQATVLEWGASLSSRVSSRPRD